MCVMIRSISISGFRGFRKLGVDPLDRFNLFLGRNNVGKTAFLEACYLLAGPTNPELPLRINAFRGIEQLRMDPDELWGWLFNNKDLTSTIELRATLENGRERTLKILLKEPKEYRGLSGRGLSGRGRSARKKSMKNDLLTTATTGTTSPPDLILRYRNERGESINTRAYLKEGGLGFEHDRTERLPNSIYMVARAGYSSENPERFSKLEEIGAEQQLLPPMKVLEPRLKRLAVLVTGNGPMVHGDIGLGRMVPIPMMGEGMGKLLTLLLSISTAKDAAVLIDEIETGLHYSVMSQVWTAVAQAARKNNTQVLATTHSWECLLAAHQAFSSGEAYDFRLHRLDRFNGEVESQTYDRKKIELAIESGLELR